MKKGFKTYKFWGILLATITLVSFSSCSKFDREIYPLQNLIVIPDIPDSQEEEFNRDVLSEFTSLKKENGEEFSGYLTTNKIFLEKVITPLVTPHIEKLSQMSKTEIINYFTLFSFEIYQRYFGKSFYRWGGDILDLDDPQERGVRSKFAYGLDCSGFVSMPYELAVYFGLLKEEEVLFSSKGYWKYCIEKGKSDIGGREGTSNNFRLDTPELAELGMEVFKLEKDQKPTEKQINMLQPGDIVGRSGHFGIIANLKGKPHYFESGGWVVPRNDGTPVIVAEALEIFASSGSITVRRCLD